MLKTKFLFFLQNFVKGLKFKNDLKEKFKKLNELNNEHKRLWIVQIKKKSFKNFGEKIDKKMSKQI